MCPVTNAFSIKVQCHTSVCMCVGCSSGREALCCSSKRAQRSCCGSSSPQQSTCQAAFGPTQPFQRPCCSHCHWGQQSHCTTVTGPNSLCYPAASSLTSCCCCCCASVLKQCTMGCSGILPTWATPPFIMFLSIWEPFDALTCSACYSPPDAAHVFRRNVTWFVIAFTPQQMQHCFCALLQIDCIAYNLMTLELLLALWRHFDIVHQPRRPCLML